MQKNDKAAQRSTTVMRQLLAVSAVIGLSFSSDALARSDSILTVVTPKPAATVDNGSGAVSQSLSSGSSLSSNGAASEENTAPASAAPVDLTTLIKHTEDDASAESADNTSLNTNLNNTALNNTAATEAGDNTETAVQPAAPSISLKRKDPSSIRLAAVGVDRDSLDGLDSLMWQGSDANTILSLQEALANSAPPSAFDAPLHHLTIARVVPPEGFVDQAPALIETRLNALAKAGASDDLAALVAQLPTEERWQDWQKWLAVHHLITRNDNAACTAARDQVGQTLDPLWHQINTFCAVVAGDADQASFALDILMDSGLSTSNFDQLMRQLIGQTKADDLDMTTVSGLDLVLMDSARITIEPEALSQLDQGHYGSVMSLRYLSDDSLRLLNARHFNHDDMISLKTSWALLPIRPMSSAEALTRFSVGGDADDIALARLDAWQTIAAEKDDRTAAQLAYEALIIDYNYAGIRGFSLWLPIIERGADSLDLEDKIGPVLGFVPETSRLTMSKEAMAWHDLLAFSRKPTDVENLEIIAGFDSLPLLNAINVPVEAIDWMTVSADGDTLSGAGMNVPYQALMQLVEIANQERKAETLMRAALLLDGVDLATLNRDDAALIVSVLHQVGMKDTARALARDILVSWGAARHFNPSVSPQSADQAS